MVISNGPRSLYSSFPFPMVSNGSAERPAPATRLSKAAKTQNYQPPPPLASTVTEDLHAEILNLSTLSPLHHNPRPENWCARSRILTRPRNPTNTANLS
ncbi:hypothetical protein PtB15_10B283 [Puccinia triticina]|nr:hypothetical protein PtB15_10B283 [Puccinia triticina]